MTIIVLVILGIVIVNMLKLVAEAGKKENEEKKQKEILEEYEKKKPYLAQKALDYYLLTEKAFMLNYMPFVDYLESLHHYYKYGGKPLSQIELNKYFSYPKFIYLNEKDEVICNGVNLGPLGGKWHPDGNWLIENTVICPLFKCDYNDYTNFSTCDNFKFNENGKRYIADCHWTRDFTTYKDLEHDTIEFKKIPPNEIDKKQDEVYAETIKEFNETYEENKGWLEKYLPDDLKETYKLMNEGNKTKEEIEKILAEYYYRSNRNYLVYLKEKGLKEVNILDKAKEQRKTSYKYDFGEYHKYTNKYYSASDAEYFFKHKICIVNDRVNSNQNHGLYETYSKDTYNPRLDEITESYNLKYRY